MNWSLASCKEGNTGYYRVRDIYLPQTLLLMCYYYYQIIKQIFAGFETEWNPLTMRKYFLSHQRISTWPCGAMQCGSMLTIAALAMYSLNSSCTVSNWKIHGWQISEVSLTLQSLSDRCVELCRLWTSEESVVVKCKFLKEMHLNSDVTTTKMLSDFSGLNGNYLLLSAIRDCATFWNPTCNS